MIGVAALPLLIGVVPADRLTPQSAARRLVYSSNGSKVIIVRTNIVGPYATVLIHGGYLEGSTTAGAALLLKRFSFGWQGLESLNFRCRLDHQVRSPWARAQLIRGMPAPTNERACGTGGLVDVGPPNAVDAIRQHRSEPFVPSVVISGNYALMEWYGAGGGGGEALYRKRGNGWHVLTGGGGALDVTEMRQYGVPKTAWCPFGINDAYCTLRR